MSICKVHVPGDCAGNCEQPATGAPTRCIRCGHASTQHAVDDEERRECNYCACAQFECAKCEHGFPDGLGCALRCGEIRAEETDPDAVREPATGAGPWRQGRKVGRTLYFDDILVGMVDTPNLAAAICAAMNKEKDG